MDLIAATRAEGGLVSFKREHFISYLDLDCLVVDDSLPGSDVNPDGGDEVVRAGVVQEFIK